jgi:hypothetical protein
MNYESLQQTWTVNAKHKTNTDINLKIIELNLVVAHSIINQLVNRR